MCSTDKLGSKSNPTTNGPIVLTSLLTRQLGVLGKSVWSLRKVLVYITNKITSCATYENYFDKNAKYNEKYDIYCKICVDNKLCYLIKYCVFLAKDFTILVDYFRPMLVV